MVRGKRGYLIVRECEKELTNATIRLQLRRGIERMLHITYQTIRVARLIEYILNSEYSPYRTHIESEVVQNGF